MSCWIRRELLQLVYFAPRPPLAKSSPSWPAKREIVAAWEMIIVGLSFSRADFVPAMRLMPGPDTEFRRRVEPEKSVRNVHASV